MSNKGKQLAAMMTLALAAGDNSFLSSTQGVPDEGRVVKPIPKVIPRGMTEYHFDDGFQCYALNIKNALKKHDKWIKTNEQ